MAYFACCYIHPGICEQLMCMLSAFGNWGAEISNHQSYPQEAQSLGGKSGKEPETSINIAVLEWRLHAASESIFKYLNSSLYKSHLKMCNYFASYLLDRGVASLKNVCIVSDLLPRMASTSRTFHPSFPSSSFIICFLPSCILIPNNLYFMVVSA